MAHALVRSCGYKRMARPYDERRTKTPSQRGHSPREQAQPKKGYEGAGQPKRASQRHAGPSHPTRTYEVGDNAGQAGYQKKPEQDARDHTFSGRKEGTSPEIETEESQEPNAGEGDEEESQEDPQKIVVHVAGNYRALKNDLVFSLLLYDRSGLGCNYVVVLLELSSCDESFCMICGTNRSENPATNDQKASLPKSAPVSGKVSKNRLSRFAWVGGEANGGT